MRDRTRTPRPCATGERRPANSLAEGSEFRVSRGPRYRPLVTCLEVGRWTVVTSEANTWRMGRTAAAIGSVIFFILAPGVVAYLVPFLLAQTQAESWQLDPPVVKWAGLALGLAGTIALIECFARFAWQGIGTPAPIAPTEHLVVTGLYRHVRNPMYVAVLTIILAQAMWFASLAVLIYAAIVWAAVTAFVVGYEEPTLARTFGEEYTVYRANVRRWIPRIVPWNAPSSR